MNLGHSISQIMKKASQPSYPIKTNLIITSLIETLGFTTSSKNKSLEAPQTQYKRPQSHSTLRLETLEQKPI